MDIQLLKSKLHAIFEDVQYSFSEDSTTPAPSPVANENPGNNQPALTYKSKDGIEYTLAQNPVDQKITVTDANSNVVDTFTPDQQDQSGAKLSSEDRKAIVNTLNPSGAQTASVPAVQPEQTNTPAVVTPTETPIAESENVLPENLKK